MTKLLIYSLIFILASIWAVSVVSSYATGGVIYLILVAAIAAGVASIARRRS